MRIAPLPRTLEIICTDGGQHPIRELVVIEPVILDHAHLEECENRHSVTHPTDPWWTWCSDETHGFRVRGSSFGLKTVTGFHAGELVTESDGTRTRQKRNVESRLGANGWTLHVPRCPSCGRAERLQVAKLARFAKAADSPRAVLDVSAL